MRMKSLYKNWQLCLYLAKNSEEFSSLGKKGGASKSPSNVIQWLIDVSVS